jgi:hypothetical protein
MAENYQLLADAIVLLAVSDYRDAYKMRRLRPHDNVVVGKLEQIERFFRSRWFGILTGADGERFLERIENGIDAIPCKVKTLHVISDERTKNDDQ